MRKPLVYVAGPYTDPDPIENAHKAISIAFQIHDAYGVPVYVPHLSAFQQLVVPRSYGFWMNHCLGVLPHCSILYRMPGHSKGADVEVDNAKLLGIPVVTTFAQLKEEIDSYELARQKAGLGDVGGRGAGKPVDNNNRGASPAQQAGGWQQFGPHSLFRRAGELLQKLSAATIRPAASGRKSPSPPEPASRN